MWYTFHFDPLIYFFVFVLGLFLQTLVGGLTEPYWHSVHLLV